MSAIEVVLSRLLNVSSGSEAEVVSFSCESGAILKIGES
jgi:hypothetical protein